VEPGEVVVVRGSLPQLGNWGAGVPLARSDRYPGVRENKKGRQREDKERRQREETKRGDKERRKK